MTFGLQSKIFPDRIGTIFSEKITSSRRRVLGVVASDPSPAGVSFHNPAHYFYFFPKTGRQTEIVAVQQHPERANLNTA